MGDVGELGQSATISRSCSESSVPDSSDLVGAFLHHFRIDARLGAGGMGVVYRALDTKLHREVAVKVLAPRYIVDERNSRMLFREARLAAKLAHPSIAAIYEVHEDYDPAFLVMELVRGESLRARLDRASLERSEALRIGCALGRALAVAHAAGLVHRDVKPANVMLTETGDSKLLDFGVAKVLDHFGDDPTASVAPSIDGRIVGTPEYMSPEQAMGMPIDARSDLFSLGVILYEMLTGQRPFHRDTPMLTLTAISRDEPPALDVIRPALGTGLAAVIQRCLAKRPEDRFASASELVAALESAERSPHRPRRARRIALVAAAGLGVFVLDNQHSRQAQLVERILRSTPGQDQIALAPDASAAAILGDGVITIEPLRGGGLRRVALPAALGKPASLDTLALSPDGHTIVASGGPKDHETAWLLPTDGRPAESVGSTFLGGGTLSPDGRRIVFRGLEGVYVRDLAGGEPLRILVLAAGENAFAFAWSPKGDEIAILVASSTCTTDGRIVVASADGARVRVVHRGDRLVSVNCATALAWPSERTVAYGLQPLNPVWSASILELAVDSPSDARVTAFEWPDAEVRGLRKTARGWLVDKLIYEPSLARLRLDSHGLAAGAPEIELLPKGRGIRGVFSDGRALHTEINAENLVDLFVITPENPAAGSMLARSTPRLAWGRVAIAAGDEIVFWRNSAGGCRLAASARGGVERLLPVAADAEPIACGSALRCARGVPGKCAIMEVVTGRARFSMFDTRSGARSRVFFQMAGDHAQWAISRDGEQLVVVGDPSATVSLVSTKTGEVRAHKVLDVGFVDEAIFTNDGRALIATVTDLPGASAYEIVRAELDGATSIVWRDPSRQRSVEGPLLGDDDSVLTTYSRTYRTQIAELARAQQ